MIFLKYDPLELCDHCKHTGDYYFMIKRNYMSLVNKLLALGGTKKVF